jgi:hypothetical protein
MPFRWWPRRTGPPTPPPPTPPERARRAQPQPFRSPHYGYRLLLPPDWQVGPERVGGPAGPAVEVFAHPEGPIHLSIWAVPSTLLALPPVPRDQRAFTAPPRWPGGGDRAASEAARASELLRPLWSSLEVEA